MLSQAEAARLEHYGIWPACKQHRHLKKREAMMLLNADVVRFVGGADTCVPHPTTMMTACTNNTYEWRNRPSGHKLGFVVKQLVRTAVR
jgi:hypothetical protein